MTKRMRGNWGRKGRRRLAAHALLVALAIPLAGCLSETFQRGYGLPEGALEQIRLGASQEQVLIVLGTPSTTSTVGGDAWYYIGQKMQHTLSFLPVKMTDQHVLAVYFDKSGKVDRIANYGMQDGKVFDFVSRTTPTGGSEPDFLKNIMGGLFKFT